ncbi:hypothetical protein ACJX0J_034231, partial [Zea mays]
MTANVRDQWNNISRGTEKVLLQKKKDGPGKIIVDGDRTPFSKRPRLIGHVIVARIIATQGYPKLRKYAYLSRETFRPLLIFLIFMGVKLIYNIKFQYSGHHKEVLHMKTVDIDTNDRDKGMMYITFDQGPTSPRKCVFTSGSKPFNEGVSGISSIDLSILIHFHKQ